jgi:hypothetical protein
MCGQAIDKKLVVANFRVVGATFLDIRKKMAKKVLLPSVASPLVRQLSLQQQISV